MKKYLFLLATVFMCTMPWSNVIADVTYSKGERILGRDNVHDGDFIIIEVGSTSTFSDYYIKDNHNKGFRWQKGFDQGCIWQVESTGTGNQYYFKNAETGLYMGGNNHEDPKLVSKGSANKITLLAKDEEGNWGQYGDQNGYPKSWDEYSVALKYTTPSGSTGYYGNNESGRSTGLFYYDTSVRHNLQWNLYTAVPAAVTYETSLTDGKYYYIISNYTNFSGASGTQAMCYNAENTESPYWGAFDDTNNKYIFKLIKADGDNNWYIQNAYNEKYFYSETQNAGTLAYSTTQKAAYEIINIGDNLFSIRKTGDTYYVYPGYYGTSDHSTGTLSSDHWGSDSNAPNDAGKWLFRAVSEENISAITTAKETAINPLKTELAKYNGTNGLIFGMTTDNYNKVSEEVNNMSVENNSLEYLDNYSFDSYITNLTTGYYRIANARIFDAGKDYTTVATVDDSRYLVVHSPSTVDANLLSADVKVVKKSETQSDLSSVFKITVNNDGTSTVMSQGLSLRAGWSKIVPDKVQSQKATILPFANNQNTQGGIASINFTDEHGNGSYYMTLGGDNKTGQWTFLSGNENTLKYYIIPATDITVNMNSVKGDANTYATLYAPFAITLQEGLTAYTGTLNTDNTKLTLSPIEGSVVPAATPVVLIGSEKSYTLDIATDNTSNPISSAFTGQYLADTDEDTGEYTLGAKNNVVGFYPYKDAIKANKARLILGSSKGSKGFAFSFGDDDPAGINTATAEGAALKVGDVIYDLQGRKVKDAKRGIYIINGKKTVVK